MRLICRNLLAAILLLPSASFTQDVFNNCPMEGKINVRSAAAKQRLQDLNRLKNRYDLPAPSDLNTNIILVAILRRGNDQTRWNTSDAAVVEGYVYAVKIGGKETCNCGAAEPLNRDTHIELTLGPSPSQTKAIQRVVVEVTPRLRKKMERQKVDWTTDALTKNIKHHRIRVTGWMFFDAEHDDESENTNPHDQNNWRATAWEIHPITSIEVLDTP